ncbi:hypothetical protein [Aureimonas populi]|uniref:Uncharacterized protein n=1 Tax=Aureimonas populi TaxID=1701758 RepID=A0ABW5CJX2_9HYPH|nr:hypothetical protein [Aureimonas populi]
MILRLASVTILLALFAIGFGTLARHESRSADDFAPRNVAGCYDQGAVCPPSRG